MREFYTSIDEETVVLTLKGKKKSKDLVVRQDEIQVEGGSSKLSKLIPFKVPYYYELEFSNGHKIKCMPGVKMILKTNNSINPYTMVDISDINIDDEIVLQ